MGAEQDIGIYFDTMEREGIYPNKGNLHFALDSLFEKIDFEELSVLDVGGGSGLLSFYAACRGAKNVVCLEPEGEGSSVGTIEKFRKLSSLLNLKNVLLRSETLQAYEPGAETFDMILLYNSVNHLDETACINMLTDDDSKAIYHKLFSKISSLSNGGAKLILCDCSRYNLFPLLKIRNPIDPSIEWYKHQAPEVWANLLGEAGFVNPRIRWSSFNRLRTMGRILFGNKLMAYFLTSHFCLTMEKP
jgi:SAM-dependent methyltransferase